MGLFGFKKRTYYDGLGVATDEIGSNYFQLLKLVIGGLGTDGGPVSATNPLPVTSSGASSLTAGNVISEGAVAVATINAAGAAGTKLITAGANTIVSILIFSTMTSAVELSFDAGATWVRLPVDFNPTIEFGDKGRKITSDVKVRSVSGAGTATGTDIVAWGTI